MKLKSNHNLELFSRETPKKFCLRTSLEIVNVKIYVNLNKKFLTVKVGEIKVWSGNFETKWDDIIDFTEKNLKTENKEDSKKFESVDQIIHHFIHEMLDRMDKDENSDNDSGGENEDKEEGVNWKELENKLEKFTSK